MIVLLIFLWWIVGAGSFIYWWTKYLDFTVGEELVVAVIAGVFGPLAFLIGWMVHGDKPEITIFKQRKKKCS